MRLLLLSMLTGTLVLTASCTPEPEKPAGDSEAYRQVVSDFYISLAAIQADQALFAVEKMEEVAKQYPPEAAAWANLAVFAMRQGNFDLARERIRQAIERAPENGDIYFLAGLIESRRGEVDRSVTYLRQAAELSPDDMMIAYALAEELERQDNVENAPEVFSLLQSMLKQQPENLAVLLEMVRTSVKWNNNATLKQGIDELTRLSENWPEDVQRQFQQIKETILDESTDNLTFQLAFLQNNLNQLPQFQSDLAAVQIPPTQVGFLITEFTWLPEATNSAAIPDRELSFTPAEMLETKTAEGIRSVALNDDAEAEVITVSGGTARISNNRSLPFPGRALSHFAVETIDYNYDFMNDLAFAGSSGFRLYRQEEDSSLTDVSSSLNLRPSVMNRPYDGVWARDIDLDGDLDLLLSASDGPLLLLRNNGDGTFSQADLFGEVDDVVNFEWADFDGDADPDAAFLHRDGSLSILHNDRSGQFSRTGTLPELPGIIDIEVSDINNDGNYDLLAWTVEGIERLYVAQATGSWTHSTLVNEGSALEGATKAGSGHLFSMDIDNNGANDLVASTPVASAYWLSDENLVLDSSATHISAGIRDIADLDGDTRLDLLRLDADGQPATDLNSGGKDYLGRVIRPRASGPLGDRRINSFGIGGSIEIRSGLLYQKQQIKQPWVHLGLGNYDEAELLRIIWPNGSSQAEFAELGYDSKIFNEQILKGSCPWVFAYNGEEMEFITDFLWRTGLGIRINAQGDANVIHSIDWIKIDGEQLKPKNGRYDIRITADLWETHFFDHVSLMTVDHPDETEVFVDERFSFPPSEPTMHVMRDLQPVAKATDQDGRDVTGAIRENDMNFVDTFELTQYQGLAKDHYIELDLGEEVPEKGIVRLVALGWIYPTDTSVNIAISQGDQPAPRPLSLHVPDGEGGWKVARENIGFPAGKSKTMLIDLSDVFEPGTEKKVRLVTNMEIYWNQIRWGVEAPETEIHKNEIPFAESRLRYRGFSKVNREGRFVPEQPDYRQISGTTPMWYDLEGYYTRFGEVDELLRNIDDRFVIMNAGDELVFSFEAPVEPESGWDRDFILVGDGWVKDGDFNTGFSTTVLPLPYHGMEDYTDKPGRLQDDPVYQNHKEDWARYHTRYITPRPFQQAFTFDSE